MMLNKDLLLLSQKESVIPSGGYLFQVKVGAYTYTKEGSNTATDYGYFKEQNIGNLSPKEIAGIEILTFAKTLLTSLSIQLKIDKPILSGSFAQRLDTNLKGDLFSESQNPGLWAMIAKSESGEPLPFFTVNDLNKTIPVLVVPIFA